VIALERRSSAAISPVRRLEPLVEHWSRAVGIRREWLAHGLSTAPADRPTVEQTITRLYARVARSRPRFVWVDSPHQALPLLTGLPTHDVLLSWVVGRTPPGAPPAISDLAAALSRLRSSLEAAAVHPDLAPPPSPSRKSRSDRDAKPDWTRYPPDDALAAGAALRDVLRIGVYQALRTSLADGLYLPIREILAVAGPVPAAWYGQQDASWIAYYDTLRRLGLAHYGRGDAEHLDEWATLARTGGWWWPGEDVCVVVDRPAAVRAELLAGGRHDEIRPVAVEYRDGWRPRLRTR
jgi:hypothetical protein